MQFCEQRDSRIEKKNPSLYQRVRPKLWMQFCEQSDTLINGCRIEMILNDRNIYTTLNDSQLYSIISTDSFIRRTFSIFSDYQNSNAANDPFDKLVDAIFNKSFSEIKDKIQQLLVLSRLQDSLTEEVKKTLRIAEKFNIRLEKMDDSTLHELCTQYSELKKSITTSPLEAIMFAPEASDIMRATTYERLEQVGMDKIKQRGRDQELRIKLDKIIKPKLDLMKLPELKQFRKQFQNGPYIRPLIDEAIHKKSTPIERKLTLISDSLLLRLGVVAGLTGWLGMCLSVPPLRLASDTIIDAIFKGSKDKDTGKADTVNSKTAAVSGSRSRLFKQTPPQKEGSSTSTSERQPLLHFH